MKTGHKTGRTVVTRG